MENWFETNETQEAMISLQMMSEQLDHLAKSGNKHYWTWKNDVALWTRTLADEPNSMRARVWLALDLKEQGRREEALTLLDEAIRINPQDVSGFINRGILWGEMGYYDRAEADLAEAVRRRPESSSAHWNLAVMLQHKGDIGGMLRELEKTLELNPEHEKALQVKKSLESAVPENR